MSQKSQEVSSAVEGNTKLQRARRWCFTLNNYTNEDLSQLSKYFEQTTDFYIIGKEIGESGTPHLQGYFERKQQVRFDTLKKIMPKCHLEKAKGNRLSNVEYCSKTNDYIAKEANNRENRILKNRYSNIVWKPWQQKILSFLELGPATNSRDIYWYWEPTGNVGKTFLCKYLCIKYDAIIASGKKDDIFNQVKNWLDANKDKDPFLILIDIPRSSQGSISYGAIEACKNGLMYSGKYEGGKCVFDWPHIIIFSNDEPDYHKMSADKFKVELIEE